MSINEIKKNNLKNINIKNQVNSTTPRSMIWDRDKKNILKKRPRKKRPKLN
jgi:hypothetical protein